MKNIILAAALLTISATASADFSFDMSRGDFISKGTIHNEKLVKNGAVFQIIVSEHGPYSAPETGEWWLEIDCKRKLNRDGGYGPKPSWGDWSQLHLNRNDLPSPHIYNYFCNK